MVSCDSLDKNQIGYYTFKQENLGVFSLIDHLFVQECLIESVDSFTALDERLNLSDHLPIVCILQCGVLSNEGNPSHTEHTNVIHHPSHTEHTNVIHHPSHTEHTNVIHHPSHTEHTNVIHHPSHTEHTNVIHQLCLK